MPELVVVEEVGSVVLEVIESAVLEEVLLTILELVVVEEVGSAVLEVVVGFVQTSPGHPHLRISAIES